MTLKDKSGLYFSPRVTPIWKTTTYKTNLSKNNAEYEEKSYSLLVPEKVCASVKREVTSSIFRISRKRNKLFQNQLKRV